MTSLTAFQSFNSSYLQERFAFLANSTRELFRRFLLWSVSAGPIPKHVAIIMDGNRRYAKNRNMQKWRGHEYGYNSLMHTLRDCYEIGITCVSVYAFSIENFRRSKEEVETLMNLMKEKLDLLVEKESMVNKYGIRVQLIGDISLFPQNVRESAERAMAFSRNNDKAILNICAPYTGSQEIAKAVEDVLKEGDLDGKKISEEDIAKHLYTCDCPEPELLIRTSGETRLSNFLLWQTSFSLLYATPVLWPEFSSMDLVRAVLEYQRAYPFLQEKKHGDGKEKVLVHQHHD